MKQVLSVMYSILFILFVLFGPGALGPHLVTAQSKKELEKKKELLQKEIAEQNKLLNEVKKSKSRSMVELAILNNKIERQKELVQILNKEIHLLEDHISGTMQQISRKEAELKMLKELYAKIIVASYKNRNADERLLFLFASADLNQAYQRLKYLQHYSQAREKYARQIEDAQRALQMQKQELELRKQQQNMALAEKESETKKLSGQKKEKETTLGSLQKKEKNIREEIKKKKTAAEKLKKAIEKVIEEEMRKARAASKTGLPKITLTPDEQILSDDFARNKGHLPWPLAEGAITESFGTHDHPDFPGVKISNNGVNIVTNRGANVRAVFNGNVMAVASVGGVEGKVVIIKHGEYLSVYSNLSEALVKPGDKVKTRQSIGKVLTQENNITELHFEIWKGQQMLNPESWIAKGS